MEWRFDSSPSFRVHTGQVFNRSPGRRRWLGRISLPSLLQGGDWKRRGVGFGIARGVWVDDGRPLPIIRTGKIFKGKRAMRNIFSQQKSLEWKFHLKTHEGHLLFSFWDKSQNDVRSSSLLLE